MVERHTKSRLLLAAALCVAIAAPIAFGCSCDYPDIGYLAHQSVEIPLNAHGLLWAGVLNTAGGMVTFPPDTCFSVELLRGASWETVPHRLNLFRDPGASSDSFYDILIVGPETDALPGERYRYVYRKREQRGLMGATEDAAVDSQEVFVTVSTEAFAGSLQHLRTSGSTHSERIHVATSGGCGRAVDAVVMDIDEVLPVELRKWRDSLYYSTRIGLTNWHPRASICDPVPPGRSWAGIGSERLYKLTDAARATNDLLEPGLIVDANVALVEAWLPGTVEKYEVLIGYSFVGK